MTLSAPADNRIDQKFARARAENRAALILYLTSGFPDEDTTRRLLPVLAESGCDLLELGVPFSDPIADGPTIQKASTVALEGGMTFNRSLQLLREFRQRSNPAARQMPVILFGALNPFLHHGLEASARDAKAAGADGFLAADLPVEEAEEFRAPCRANGLHLILLAAPTSPDARLAAIANASSGFLYCISIKGITGARSAIGPEVIEYLERVRRHSRVPVAVGFGISRPEHVAAVRDHCDAVVVGSALISLISETKARGGNLEQAVRDYVGSLVQELRRPEMSVRP